MTKIKVKKNGSYLGFGGKYENIRNLQNESLSSIVQNYRMQVTASISSGNKVAEVNGTEIYAPTQSYNYQISGLVWFDTLQDLITYGSQYLTAGNFAATKGYYRPNDGGGALYNIMSSPTQYLNGMAQENSTQSGYGRVYDSPLVDGYSLINIGTTEIPLYADLQLMDGRIINIRQLGARPLEDGVKIDNRVYFHTAMRNFITRKRFVTRIFLPAGHYCTSPVNFYNPTNRYIALKLYGAGMNNTFLMPYEDGQEYILKVGTSVSATNCSRCSEVHDISFQCGNAEMSQQMAQLYGENKSLSRTALMMYGTYYDCVQNVSFRHVYNTAFTRIYSFEATSRNIQFHCCGGTRNKVTNPVTVWDDESETGASSLSANWAPYMHFDSCVGPLIYGANVNNFTHNEFGTIMVTGSSEEYYRYSTDQNAIDGIPAFNTSNLIRWGVLAGHYGSGSNWPNMYLTIMVNSLDNWATREIGSTIYNYRLCGIYQKMMKTDLDITPSKYDIPLDVSGGTAYSTNVYIGNIAFPGVQDQYSSSGTYVGYNTTSSSKGAEIYIKQMYGRKQKPIYSKNRYPRMQTQNGDSRILYNSSMTASYNNSYNGAESPGSTTVSASTNGTYITFLAKAGTLYGIRYRGSGNYINAYYPGYKQGGLAIYKNSEWQPVYNLNQSSTGQIQYGSNTPFKYANLPPVYFQNDTLVKVGGNGIDFIYRRGYYSTDKFSFELIQDSITPDSGTSATYRIIPKDNSIVNYTISNSYSAYFTATIAQTSNEYVITVTTMNNNSFGLGKASNIIVTGIDSNGNVVGRASLITSQPSASISIPAASVALSSGTYQVNPTFVYNGQTLSTFSSVTRKDCSWSSSNTAVATVNNTSGSANRGVITLVKAGTSNITCTYNGISKTFKLTIQSSAT